ncbi:MAG TPA: alpha-amylase/4-alpha-glucanotransferase domain-containing protein [Dehalococcoidia bacterium]
MGAIASFLPTSDTNHQHVDANQDSVAYILKNMSDVVIQTVFGSEWNINMLGGGHNEQAYYLIPGVALEYNHLDSQGEVKEVQEIIVGNRNLGFELVLIAEPAVGFWRFPVERVSNSEAGIELIYQESCLVLLLPLDLPPGKAAELSLVWQVRKNTE